jgi:hypothetical protein
LLKKRNQERGCNLLGKEYGTPTNKQMEMINELARVELEPEQVFVFPDKLVGDMIIPNRYMQISKQLLNVFKEDANSGVSLLIDHPWAGFGRPKAAIPYGRTFNSKLKKSDVEGEEWALFADHYIVRGKEIDGISTDSIIASIQDGTFFDTSIGWGADKYECSICGNDYRDYRNCEHYAGREYEGEICHVIAKPPGFLMENSIVMDGAYPGAGVLSADGEISDSGMVMVDDLKGLSPEISLFHTFSARKGKLLTFARKEDMGKKLFAQGVNLSKGGVKYMDEKTLKLFETLGIEYKEGESKNEDLLKRVAEKWDAAVQSIKDSAVPLEPVLSVGDVVFPKEYMEKTFGRALTVGELEKLVKEGEDYLTALKKDAEEWGIRAYGDKYNKDSWNIRFQYANSTELKDIIETFKVEAESAIPTGRQSDPDADKAVKDAGGYPDEAFEM